MDKFTSIQVFLDLAETGSFTATAERLEMSKPMVSRHIALMEEWLHARLLQRTTRKVSLTDAGEQAVAFCRKIAMQTAEMEQEMAAAQGELRGVLRLTCNAAFGATHLLKQINEFLALHPKLNIQLQLTDNLVDLVAERIDLAVRFTNNPDPNLVGRKVADAHSVLVATPDYLARSGTPTTPVDLQQHQFLSHTNVNRKTLRLQQQSEPVELELNARFATNDALALLNSTLAGNGIAMLPKYMVGEHLENGTLQAVLPDWELPIFGIYLLYPSRHRLPLAVRQLIDFLVERFRGRDW
ncbi:LysR family transcriptional regulator [Cricetibacter osteomyelitidis]|uniref:LysR family transcriptional regulator n=1 Tax=Cricetibacter osteomyelitidis TaxID=1521931 RepID=A0A4R2T8R4_9PAST|nr:LysR family transcriptional regulator [Cricetibacter osteomyelitidis]TCP97264.1 LysR family transcriptional regulator [Cricetibacter osteomyelitidis]